MCVLTTLQMVRRISQHQNSTSRLEHKFRGLAIRASEQPTSPEVNDSDQLQFYSQAPLVPNATLSSENSPPQSLTTATNGNETTTTSLVQQDLPESKRSKEDEPEVKNMKTYVEKLESLVAIMISYRNKNNRLQDILQDVATIVQDVLSNEFEPTLELIRQNKAKIEREYTNKLTEGYTYLEISGKSNFGNLLYF